MGARIIVCEGTHGTGKSTVVDGVVSRLLALGLRARAFHHRAPKPGAEAIEACLWYALQRVELARTLDASTEVLVVDRWWHSTWVKALALNSVSLVRIAKAEASMTRSPSLVFVLDAGDQVLALRRPSPDAEEVETRRIYRELARCESARFGPELFGVSQIVPIDTSTSTPEETADGVARVLCGALEAFL